MNTSNIHKLSQVENRVNLCMEYRLFFLLGYHVYIYIYMNMVKTKERLYTIFCGVATCHICQKECTNCTMWNSCIVSSIYTCLSCHL